MHKFVRNLITEWRNMGLPFTGETIVVAVSGGADSMSLLLAIHDLAKRKKIGHRVVVAHLNHGLRGGEGDVDEKFVQGHSANLGFEFVAGSTRLTAKGNLEQAARDARYKFLSRTARENGAFAVLTAHTQNDQAETLLFNLIRGSGPDGLAGMKPIRELGGGASLVRPLMSWAGRTDTESFCRQNGIKYRTDRMNNDEKYSRVRIRKNILPRLTEINPRIVETLARTAELMRRYSDSEAFESPAADREDLVLKDLKGLKSLDISTTIRSWLRARRGNLRSLQLNHIEAIERLIASRKSGTTVELPGGGLVVKQGGALTFRKIQVEK